MFDMRALTLWTQRRHFYIGDSRYDHGSGHKQFGDVRPDYSDTIRGEGDSRILIWRNSKLYQRLYLFILLNDY